MFRQCSVSLSSRLLSTLCLMSVSCLFAASSAHAQTTRKASSTSNNTQGGTLVSMDTDTATVVLKTRLGTNVNYRYTEKTHLYHDKKACEIAAFKAGEPIVVRFKKSKVGAQELYDLSDKVSWEWINRIRHEMTLVTVKEMADDSLTATEGPDNAPIEYRITDKTQFAKNGKPATAADFKAGDKVYVAPRLLPRGNLMAVAIADRTDSTAQLKERTGRYVTGTLLAFDTTKKTIGMRSLANDERELPLAPDCTVKMASKQVTLAALRQGQNITVRLAKDDENEVVVTNISILSKKPTKKPIKKPTIKPLTPGKPATPGTTNSP